MKSTVLKLSAHEKRAVGEAFEVQERLSRLCAFLGSSSSANLSDEDRANLNEQAAVMSEYLRVLDARLASFEARIRRAGR